MALSSDLHHVLSCVVDGSCVTDVQCGIINLY